MTESATEERTLEITRILNAPRELVFAAWTKPEHLVKWFGPKDFTVPAHAMEFREGGEYRFVMRSPEGKNHPVYGVYKEITPPSRIVFTWEREDLEGADGSGTTVSITLEPHGEKTKLTLRHSVFKSKDGRDSHFGGWSECIERLAAYVEHSVAA